MLTLLFGLLGALSVTVALLALPLRFSLRLEYPGGSGAEIRLYGWTLSRWAPLRPNAERSPAEAPSEGSGQTASPLRYIEALGAFLSPIRRAPVEDLRVAARGSTGDPAATALLYGAAWSLLGTVCAARGLRPQRADLQPVLAGPAEMRALGEAKVRITVGSLLLGAVRALRVLRAASG